MWIVNYLKSKIITTAYIVCSGKSYLKKDNTKNGDFSKIIEKYSCWCALLINGVEIEAKIIHKGRGKFKIVEDKYRAIYVNQIVDASDVIHCKVKSEEILNYVKSKLISIGS
jgi:hypothetical protein